MPKATEEQLTADQLLSQLSALTADVEKSTAKVEQHYRDLHTHFDGVKADSAEIKAKVEQHAKDYAGLVTELQGLKGAVDQVKRDLSAPVYQAGSDLKDADMKHGLELQRRAHIFKHGNDDDFKADPSKAIDVAELRGAVRKLTKVGLVTKEEAVRTMTQAERHAFEASSLDSAFFSPEILGYEEDCTRECATMVDLYGQVTVSRSTFMYPAVNDYGAIGQYDCDAKCDAEYGPEGNIRWKNGKTFDFRGVFCFQKKVLQEANYDFLGFMMSAAQRSHRFNRNRALMVGDGVNEPLGWLTADCFAKLKTPQVNAATSFTHIDFRRFMSSAPVEYGEVTSVMHQNVFGYLAATTDEAGRFIFGDGLMGFSPSDVRDRIRISNCLPDATEGNTKGSVDAPFDADAFLLAAGNWPIAMKSVNRRPMWMEQYIGGTSAWCVKYQFGAEDGGFVGCCPAARVLTVG